MITGHFGLAAGVKSAERAVPLWALMLATVWLDILFTPLFLAGVETVVTGHFPTTLRPSDLRTYAEFVRELVEAVAAARCDGVPIDDFAAAWRIPERYESQGYVSFAHLRPIRADVEAIWTEIARADR